MCDCTGDNPEPDSAIQTEACNDKPEDLRPPFTVLRLEVSRSALNLVSSSSARTCDDEVEKSTTTFSDEKATCDCTSEESSCTESKSSLESESSDELERTLAIVKPEALIFREEIENAIIDAGFQICQTRWLKLTPEQVSDFYLDKFKDECFARLVAYMSSGPILVHSIGKINAVQEWRALIGPKKVTDARLYAPDTIRGRFGRLGDDMINAVHGSKDRRSAEREIRFFFPDQTPEQLPTEDSAEDYLWRRVNPILNEALVKCFEAKPDDPVTWLGNWLLDNNSPTYLLRYKSNLYD
ncbi:nucleoside diphosphate kinase homolog 5-like [Nasonia vitripennis]|uniref:Nucleoside diphosphate kinase-like domain-containing protein n=1 Tax=Nasonia vitripennis TaxID=7425 RepID=A0A7M7HBZ3_NASVI|nr:nucleoside diphosphate kinase homolog 5-like [Nasonia vitripennis]